MPFATNSRRFQRELKTIRSMVRLACTHPKPPGEPLCDECRELLHYAEKRLQNCPHGETKPACEKCPIHCYNKEMREKMRRVMRTSGPKMALRHPFLTLLHFIDSRSKLQHQGTLNN